MLDKIKGGLAGAGRTARVSATLGAVLLAGLFFAPQANAADGDDPAGAAIDALGAKVTAYGAAMVAVVVIAVGLMLGIKYLRKAGSKA